jgi:hypothetical protein
MRANDQPAPARAPKDRCAPLHGRMSVLQRAAIFGTLGVLWLSGCLWLLLDQYWQRPGEFGLTPHPWQAPILLIHGVIAVLSMYLLGWVTARHVAKWWRAGLRRVSGASFAALLGLLALSGFALFFVSDDRWQRAAALSHDVVGIAITLSAIQHWCFARRRVIRSAASRP